MRPRALNPYVEPNGRGGRGSANWRPWILQAARIPVRSGLCISRYRRESWRTGERVWTVVGPGARTRAAHGLSSRAQSGGWACAGRRRPGGAREGWRKIMGKKDNLRHGTPGGSVSAKTGHHMALDTRECEATALMLPAAERAALAERLIESLDTLDDAENERLWVEEAERRYQAYRQGSLSARSATEAIQEARSRLR